MPLAHLSLGSVPNSTPRHLLSIVEDHQLTQLITQSTRITANSITIIDHCYTSSPHSFSSAGFSPLAWGDLLRIFASRPCSNDKAPTPKFKEIRSFRKCNFENLFKHLANMPWGRGGMIEFDHVDDKWAYWKTLFLHVAKEHVPTINVRCKQRSHPWVSNETRQLMKS